MYPALCRPRSTFPVAIVSPEPEMPGRPEAGSLQGGRPSLPALDQHPHLPRDRDAGGEPSGELLSQPMRVDRQIAVEIGLASRLVAHPIPSAGRPGEVGRVEAP